MMPSDGDHVLRLDVESGELKTFEINHLLGKNVHKNKFQGGVVTPLNVIYAIPANANHVLRIDASSNSVSVLSTEISGSRRCKFQGAFFSSIDEACYFLPEHSDSILRISKSVKNWLVYKEGRQIFDFNDFVLAFRSSAVVLYGAKQACS